jgi:hypothetical protein
LVILQFAPPVTACEKRCNTLMFVLAGFSPASTNCNELIISAMADDAEIA